MDNVVTTVVALVMYWTATGLLNAVAARESQLDAWVIAHPKAGAVLKVLRGLGLDPWIIRQGLYLWGKKTLPPELLGRQPTAPASMASVEDERVTPLDNPPNPPGVGGVQ